MSVPYRLRPGAGFVLLVVVVLTCLSFFAWGLAKPDLDEVWRLQLELKVGRRAPLSSQEMGLLQRALCEHPSLADALVDEGRSGLISANRDGAIERGYGYAVLRGGGAISAVAVKSDKAVEVRARTLGATSTGKTPFDWAPPAKGKCPTLVEVLVPKQSVVRVTAR